MKIVVLDGYSINPGDLSWDRLALLGDLTVHDRTPKVEALSRIGQAEIALTNKTVLSAETLTQAPNLKYVGVLATGYNIVDVRAAAAKGIVVANVPSYGTEAVAQFAIALMLELCHHVGLHSRLVAEGRWEKNLDYSFWETPLVELVGKVLGVIGFGRIGRQTAKIARALGMRVVAHTPHPEPEDADLAEFVSLDRLLSDSDVITLHCPLTPSTEGIINKANLAKMKKGVLIVNNSRGQLVVEEDLAAALESGQVQAAAVDVVSAEPIRSDNPLLKAKNCLITPHISWAPKETRQRLLNTAIDNVEAFLKGAPANVIKG
ncbi:MAG: D-2-hydroxyacid dehydrogenase [Deltaproteobacteria bacterium]|nr:D-2-hydroxyacid dehydrogenase [Deltaproteobacteria bacterium]